MIRTDPCEDDWGVLQSAFAFEQATGFWKQRSKVSI
jgi:hypothetical protein